jgi:galactokinase
MTGGGFGGCTVTLVRSGKEQGVARSICEAYRERTGIEATPFVTKPARGAHVLPA